MRLIVGLGNPGTKYSSTRHNLGFMVVEALAQKLGIQIRQFTASCIIGEGKLAAEAIILAKPLTYMNASGRAVALLVKQLGLSLAEVVVICDDLNLPLGALRIRPGGSAGGHKGLDSIIDALGNEEFPRLRLGIGSAPPGIDAADYVLQPFADEEWPQVVEMVKQAESAVGSLIEQGIAAAMNKFN